MQHEPSVTPVISGIVHDAGAVASPRCVPVFSLRQAATNHNNWSHVWCDVGHACTSSSVCSLLGRVESDCLQYWLIYEWPVSLAPSIHVPLLLYTPQGSCPCRMCPWWLHKSMTTFLRHMTHFWDTMTLARSLTYAGQAMGNVLSCTMYIWASNGIYSCAVKTRVCDESNLAPHPRL